MTKGSAKIDHAALDALFAPFDRTDAPGYAVGVALPGARPYRRGFGMASIELPVPLSPTIRMRIGSTTKHFTALALLLLEQDGRLSLNDSPRACLPELPDWADAMTLRQLLSHTSGMRDSLDLLLHSAGPGKAMPDDYQLRSLAGLDDVNFDPGSSWNYNNGGYVLASEIVARVSGQSFADFMRDHIFAPIGMHDTLVRALDTDLLPNSATLHVPRPDGGYDRGVFGAPIGGEGGIVSTIDDMLLWLRHMAAPVIGDADSWAAIRTPLTTHGYGLGLFIDRHRGLDRVGHAGAVVGGSSQMVKIPAYGLDIVIMSNGRSSLEGYKLVDTIIDLCIAGLPSAATPTDAAIVSGAFYSKASGRVLRLGEQDGTQTISIGAFTLPANRDADGALRLPYLPTDMQVMPASCGAYLDVLEYGRSDRLDRLPDETAATSGSIAGRYDNSAAALFAIIQRTDEGTWNMVLGGELGSTIYGLKPLGDHLWEARATNSLPLVATLEFEDGGFRLTTGRTTRLPFRRADKDA